jgi:hypothetical protein
MNPDFIKEECNVCGDLMGPYKYIQNPPEDREKTYIHRTKCCLAPVCERCTGDIKKELAPTEEYNAPAIPKCSFSADYITIFTDDDGNIIEAESNLTDMCRPQDAPLEALNQFARTMPPQQADQIVQGINTPFLALQKLRSMLAAEEVTRLLSNISPEDFIRMRSEIDTIIGRLDESQKLAQNTRNEILRHYQNLIQQIPIQMTKANPGNWTPEALNDRIVVLIKKAREFEKNDLYRIDQLIMYLNVKAGRVKFIIPNIQYIGNFHKVYTWFTAIDFADPTQRYFPQLLFWETTRLDPIEEVGEITYIITQDPRRYFSPNEVVPQPAEGRVIKRDDSGKFVFDARFSAGKLNREQKFETDGKFTDTRYDLYGKKFGKYRVWSPTWVLLEAGDVVNQTENKMSGLYIKNYDTGSPEIRIERDAEGRGEGWAIKYYPNGSIESKTLFKHGKPVMGTVQEYEQDGKPKDMTQIWELEIKIHNSPSNVAARLKEGRPEDGTL